MPTDPKQLESFLTKLASDDDFRATAEADPHGTYSAHGLTYSESDSGTIPSKEDAQHVVDTLNTPADESDPKIFSDQIFKDKIFADKIFADQIFQDKIFADKIFLA